MSKFRFTIKVLAIATFMFATVSIAQAQASRHGYPALGTMLTPVAVLPHAKPGLAPSPRPRPAVRLMPSIQVVSVP